MPSTGLSLQIATEVASIEALESEWNELERCTPEATGFQSYWWCLGWIKSNCLADGSPKPLVIIIREDDVPVWLLPLQVEKRYGIRWARALGQPVTQYADALAIPNPHRPAWRAAADRALEALGLVDVVALIQVRADGVLAKTPGNNYVTSGSRTAPYLDLTEDTAVSDRLAPKGSLRRRHRKLAQTAPVSFEAVIGPDESQAAVRQALRLKLLWLRSRHLHSSSFVMPAARRFFERLVAGGHVEVYSLRVGDSLAAFEIGFTEKAAYMSLMSAYDPRYAYGSPGHFLTRAVINHCRSRGLRQFDLSAPAEPYKRAISTGQIDILSIHQPLTALGRVGMFASMKLRSPFYALSEVCDRSVFAVRALATCLFRANEGDEAR